MTEPSSQDPPRSPSEDDWNTIWKSEAAALGADREVQELWTAGMMHWTAQASLWAGLVRAVGSGPARRPGPDAPPGTPAAPVPPRTVADLERRVAELERRLAERG